MNSLNKIDMYNFVKLFNLRFGNAWIEGDNSFEKLFSRHNIDIHESKYKKNGPLRKNMFLSFMELETEWIVAPVLSDLLESYEYFSIWNRRTFDYKLLLKCKKIIFRIASNPQTVANSTIENVQTNKKILPNEKPSEVEAFLEQDYDIPNLEKLPIDSKFVSIVEERIEEAKVTLKAGASLSTILLCGSILEGVLLGAALESPDKFTDAETSPKTDDGKVKKITNWTLAELINTACELELLQPGLKKFSDGLREYRNFIHPYKQYKSGFSFDKYTADVCFHILKASLANLSREK